MAAPRLFAASFLTLFILIVVESPAEADRGDNAVGVVAHVGIREYMAAAENLGASWVRISDNWFQTEPASGEFRFEALDEWAATAHDHGLNVFITLAYTPAWVPRRADGDGRADNDVPVDSTEWAAYVETAVAHHRAAGVTHFGLWNEPNLGHFWEGTPAEYVDLIAVPGAAAVRRACGDCTVLGPDLAHTGNVDDVLVAILTRAPAGTFDIVAHHIYQSFPETGTGLFDGDNYMQALDEPRLFSGRRTLREALDDAGWHGEVWITETGYRAFPVASSDAEQNQATHVARAVEEQLARDWITNTFFYELGDCGVDQPECEIDGFGLIRPTSGTWGERQFPDDFRLKPAFYALQATIGAGLEGGGSDMGSTGPGDAPAEWDVGERVDTGVGPRADVGAEPDHDAGLDWNPGLPSSDMGHDSPDEAAELPDSAAAGALEEATSQGAEPLADQACGCWSASTSRPPFGALLLLLIVFAGFRRRKALQCGQSPPEPSGARRS